jgi:DNA-directed RNA polymerase delta subunit
MSINHTELSTGLQKLGAKWEVKTIQFTASSKNLLTQNNKPRKISDLLNEIVEFLEVALLYRTSQYKWSDRH